MSEPMQKLQIDIVSDVVCPWCIIGYLQLEKALKATGAAHTIHWHPFELNPAMAPEGQNLREHLAQKYGTTPEQSEEIRSRMTSIGDELGFQFRFSEDMKTYNTFNVHQLLHWAEQQGRAHDLKLALFEAHFTNRRNLAAVSVLADVAAEVGLDRSEALAVLDDQRFASEVRSTQSHWQRQGIQGVPAIIFNGRHLVTGAQGVDNYTNIVQKLAEVQN